MPLVKCPICSGNVSSIAHACPHCGEPNSNGQAQSLRVVVRDIDLPFLSMVSLMVRWAIAAIPALIILAILFSIAGVILGGVFSGYKT